MYYTLYVYILYIKGKGQAIKAITKKLLDVEIKSLQHNDNW